MDGAAAASKFAYRLRPSPHELPACCLNSGTFARQHVGVSAVAVLMKVFCTIVTSGLLVAGCSQVIDQFYSKSNFDMQSFNADISECKKRSSFTAVHTSVEEPKDQVDDPIVRECMMAKGYVVQLETR
jgi:hypothetical protein